MKVFSSNSRNRLPTSRARSRSCATWRQGWQRRGQSAGGVDLEEEIARLQGKTAQMIADTYARLTPWQKTQVARRSSGRIRDYAAALIDEFTPPAGDRLFRDDHANVAGLGRFRGLPVAVVGHEKGADTKARVNIPRHGHARKATGYSASRCSRTGSICR